MSADLQQILSGAFHRFVTFGKGKGGSTQMDSSQFMKFAKESKLLDRKLSRTDVDLIFTKVKERGDRRINEVQFQQACMMMAQKKGIDAATFCAMAANSVPENTGSKADYVRFHDDKTTYTGVYVHGGPTTIDHNITLENLMDRSDCDIRGRKVTDVAALGTGDRYTYRPAQTNSQTSLMTARQQGRYDTNADKIQRQPSNRSEQQHFQHMQGMVSPTIGTVLGTSVGAPAVSTSSPTNRSAPSMRTAANVVRAANKFNNMNLNSPQASAMPAPPQQPVQQLQQQPPTGGFVPPTAPLPTQIDADLQRIFNGYCQFGSGVSGPGGTARTAIPLSGSGLDSSKFAKFCRDTHIIPPLTTTEVDLVFTRVKSPGQRRIAYEEFRDLALPLLASKFNGGVPFDDFLLHIARNSSNGPSNNHGTIAQSNRFHDDRSTYTGVYAKGGPTKMDSNYERTARFDGTR